MGAGRALRQAEGLPSTVVQVVHCTIPGGPCFPHCHLGCVQLLEIPSRWQENVLRKV